MNVALSKWGLEIALYLPDEMPQYLYLKFLPEFEKLKKEIPSFDFDLLFCLDYGDFERLKLPQNFSEEKIITLDYHLESDQRDWIKIINPEFSSTSEIIYLWIEETEIEIDKNIATCLLAGIISDTGGFRHISTSPQILEITSNLIKKGAPFEKITQ
jgi:phosphoesterase RecJ-like protein